MNGDGIGYIKAARDGVLYPGHLAYVPLLRACWHAARHLGVVGTHLADAVWPGRVLSALGAATACVAMLRIVGRRRGDRAGLVAGAGLAASAGLLGVGCDLESYSLALAAVLCVVWALDEDRVVAGALLLALATLLHIENALFGLAALTLTTSRVRFFLVAVSVTLAAYLASGTLGSLSHASHGFSYPLHAYTPLVACWGALRTLVFVPYPYEASMLRVVLPTTVAIGFAVLLRPVGALERRLLVAWLVPYAVVGVVFFPSDPERWIFVLPLVWMCARPSWLVVALLGLVNVALWLPRSGDRQAVDAATRAAAHLAAHDLVLMPGHGWDESLVLVRDDVEPFPLVFHAAARGGAAGLGVALDEALARSGRVVSVRLDDEPASLGYKELARFDLDRTTLPALLGAHGLSPDRDLGDGVTLWTVRARR